MKKINKIITSFFVVMIILVQSVNAFNIDDMEAKTKQMVEMGFKTEDIGKSYMPRLTGAGENLMYLLGTILVIIIFITSIYKWRKEIKEDIKKHQKEKNSNNENKTNKENKE